MVEDMITRGAEGSDEDMEAVVSYLTAYFGKVNVNTASPADLQKALGISENEAQALTSYRAKNGSYKNFEDLAKTPGLNAEKLREKRSLIAFSQ
jgi:competence protein ComEA